jgi:hypothetical protein
MAEPVLAKRFVEAVERAWSLSANSRVPVPLEELDASAITVSVVT